jgi:copper(I)-binding protein
VIRIGSWPRPPRRVVIAIAVALIPALSACEAGNNAPSLHWHQPTDGATGAAAGISISDAFVLGAPLGSTLASGQSAGMFLALYNNGAPDKLVTVSAPAASTVTVLGSQVSLPSRQPVLLTGPDPQVVLDHLRQPLSGGSSVPVTLTFQNAGSVTLNVPVLPRASFYATFAEPSASPTVTRTGRRSGTSASPSPTPSPSRS